jgi:hypothetical protein
MFLGGNEIMPATKHGFELPIAILSRGGFDDSPGGHIDSKIMAQSMNTEAYLNSPKLTRSFGRKTVDAARKSSPADRTTNKRTIPD